MLSARLTVDTTAVVGPVPRRLFGSFVEHMGRAVYEGVYQPGHPTSTPEGFRQDVLDLTRELGVTVVRYPGGNFVSGYRWEDGVGDPEKRPVRLEGAWHSIETNRFGLHEFADWAERAGVEIMEAVNLGTRGVAEAADLLEYANHPRGTELSDRRRANGRDEPFDITLWCLGNEMDGPWQIGHKTADEYGRLAAETARMMRFVDHRVELVVAGSSGAAMPTFGEWERTVLSHTADLVDHISLHAYYEENGDVATFLAAGEALGRFIDQVAEIIDETVADLPGARKIGISVDEWNVWNITRFNEIDKEPLLTGGWLEHPPIIEDDYTVTDAVVVGSLLLSMLRRVDRVSMAAQAQLVNVIAPIKTTADGPAWRQTTFHPFAQAARLATGDSLAIEIGGDTIDGGTVGAVTALDAAATVDGDRMAVFLVNRALDDDLELTAALPIGWTLAAQPTVLTVPDGGTRLDISTADAEITPRPLDTVTIEENTLTATLPALSWSVVQLKRDFR